MARRPALPPLPLDRALEALYWASLLRSRQAIADRQVAVNGAVVADHAQIVHPARDEIVVAGEPLTKGASRYVTLLVHKPAGMPVKPTNDALDLYDVLPDRAPWYTPCGTLRTEDAGIVLLTNDPDHEDAEASRWSVLTSDLEPGSDPHGGMIRTRLGPFYLNDLQEGAWQRVTGDAIGALEAALEAGIDDRTPSEDVWDEIARAARGGG